MDPETLPSRRGGWCVFGRKVLGSSRTGRVSSTIIFLFLGEYPDAKRVIELVGSVENAEFKLRGLVLCEPTSPGRFIHHVPVLGTVEHIRHFVQVYAIETIVVATPPQSEPSVFRLLRPLRYSGVEFLDYASLYEELMQEIPIDHINDEWLMHAAMNSSRLHIRKLKRVMDLVVACVGLVITMPLSILAAILIKMDSPGPVLYRQKRVGLDGQPYTLLKFRTMKHNAEQDSGAVWAKRCDRRVTRVGRILRKLRIDEIPQLINVLRGEMSLVGPRPERPEFIDAFVEAVPFYKERLLVSPGITGWAQIKYPYAASIEEGKRKLQYDLYYIKHMSFFLDSLILLRTFKTILMGLWHRDGGEMEDEEAPEDMLDILPREVSTEKP